MHETKPNILGVNTRQYPMQREFLGVAISVVLVAGTVGDYAAYAGQGTPEWVAVHGDKIPFEEACVHFPGGQLERKKYRD